MGQADALFEATRQMGLEGIVMKRNDSNYLRESGSGWLKIKHRGNARRARSWGA
jgi:ATP-dependent DNA ligase